MIAVTPLPPWSIDPADRANPLPALGDMIKLPAVHWPDRMAVHDGRRGYTFSQLEDGAQAVAAWLSARNVGPGERVAIVSEKCALMPMLAIAVWKCGAVYVPLDARQPQVRLSRLLTRLRPSVVIALDDREPVAPHGGWLGRTRLELLLAQPVAAHATIGHQPEDAAYIIFTSGSTGQPKGAEISVRSLLAYLRNHNEVLRFTPASRVLSFSPFHFDVSIEDTLLPLSVGAFVYQFNSVHAGAIMRAVLVREHITHMIAVSTLLTMMTQERHITRDKLPDIEMVMTGAEVCDPSVINVWKRNVPGTRVINAYGPTEATIVCLTFEIEQEDPERRTAYPIGRPLRGVAAKIMKDGGEVRAPGLTGELWIGGDQVMTGYFDQPDETARVLVDMDGVVFYRTGDVCSYDPEGDIVFHGRDDDEVKLAGRRIHLGEIRQIALSCPGVERAAVALVRRDQRDLIALVVISDEQRVAADVDVQLASLLPDYMRPALLGWSPALRVTSTGKTDEKELIQRLARAAQASRARTFTQCEGGTFEPVDGIDHV